MEVPHQPREDNSCNPMTTYTKYHFCINDLLIIKTDMRMKQTLGYVCGPHLNPLSSPPKQAMHADKYQPTQVIHLIPKSFAGPFLLRPSPSIDCHFIECTNRQIALEMNR